MNSFLLSIGIAIAAALIAALVAPFFIDWGGYRDFFETRASQLLGAPVKIEGDLSARLLPRPRITASEITIGDGGFHAKGLRVRLGLTPLLSGNLQVEHVRIAGAEMRIASDGSGSISGLKRPEPQADADDFTLDSIEIADGRLIISGDSGEQGTGKHRAGERCRNELLHGSGSFPGFVGAAGRATRRQGAGLGASRRRRAK